MAAILIASNCTLDTHSNLIAHSQPTPPPLPPSAVNMGAAGQVLHGEMLTTGGSLFYGTLQPPNRRVRVFSNNLNGLITMDDMHMHTDV
jgi:hypothetical protein